MCFYDANKRLGAGFFVLCYPESGIRNEMMTLPKARFVISLLDYMINRSWYPFVIHLVFNKRWHASHSGFLGVLDPRAAGGGLSAGDVHIAK